jgi:hypothetical protein
MTNKETTRMTLAAGSATVAVAQTESAALDKALETLKTYDWGADRNTLKPIDQAIVAAQGNVAALKPLEKSLVDALVGGISRSAQDYVCRKLSSRRGYLAHRTLRPGTHSGRKGGQGDAGRVAEGQQEAQAGYYRFAGRTPRQAEHQGLLEASW